MVQLPKVYVPTLAQVTAAAKGLSSSKNLSSSRVASLEGRVEEAGTGLPTSNLDMAPFALEREPHHHSSHDRRHPLPARHLQLLVVPSQSFSSLFEYQSKNRFNTSRSERKNQQFGSIISRAIKTYELNAKVIHGEPEVPGIEISMTL